MAITKIWAVKCRIEDAIDYTTNEKKTINPNYDKEEKAENLFNTLYKKSCKEEGGEGKLRENSNEIGEYVKEYIWEKDGYIKILSIKGYFDELTFTFVSQVVESEFSQK